MKRTACVLALAVLAACPSGPRGSAARRMLPSDELPVTRAVLYQNGIGYFERQGEIVGDHMVLRIRPDQIADFLKSLTVVDLGSGRAVSVALPVEKTQARMLADLPPQVQQSGGILAIAAAFRGARAEVVAEEGEASGRIVGVERVETPPSGDQAGGATWQLTLLCDGQTLRTFDVAGIHSLRVLDRSLTVGLEKALDVTLNEASWKPIELTVQLAGPSPHHIVVSYVVEMPTWKPAYRVVVAKDGALLQGWAVVDNVSGEDWIDTQLSLTAGTPLAFEYDLYTPHFMRRPNLTPAQEQMGMAPPDLAPGYSPPPPPPPMAEAAYDDFDEYERAAPSVATGSARAPRSVAKEEAKKAKPKRPAPRQVSTADLERNYQTLVSGAGVGSLFRYDIPEPVTVRDRESALVSIVSKKIPGEDVLVFRTGVDYQTPYRAVRLTNDTPFVLERGPVAIYRDSTFLGEAVAARVEKNATVFVPYAMDGRVNIFLREESADREMRLVTIVNGILHAESKRVSRYIYDVDNQSGEEIRLFAHRPKRTNWTITNIGLENAAKTAPLQAKKDEIIEEDAGYYVPIRLPATGKIAFVVEEETPAETDVEILSSQGREVVAAYIKLPDADPAISKQLQEALELSDRIATIERRLSDLGEKQRLLSEREQQVRENLNLLRKSTGNADLRSQLEKTLAELEKDLNKVVGDYVRLTEERAQLTERLAVILRGITLKRR